MTPRALRVRLTLLSTIFALCAHLQVSLSQDLRDASGPDDPKFASYFAAVDAVVAKVEKEHPADCQAVRDRLQKAHAGLVKCLTEAKGIWPQVPANVTWDNRQRWWMQLLKPFGVEEKVWDQDPHLMVTPFSDGLLTAYRWGTQPWLVTETTVHGVAYVIVADGSVHSWLVDNRLLPPGIESPSRTRLPGDPHPRLPEALLQAVGKEHLPDWYLHPENARD